METRQLGRSDLKLSVIGVGAWAMGSSGWKYGWGIQEKNQSIATIHKALELGVNWIDTAPIYGLGHSEEVVGEAIKGLNSRPLIATKCGRRWDNEGMPYGDLSRNAILAELDDSLRRLQVEVIDLYQLHWPLPDEQIEEAWAAMAEGVKAGKVRYIGVSNCNVLQIKRLMPIHTVTSVQPPYSMLRRDIEQELLSFCKSENIGVVCYSPMQKGILTDKFSKAFVESLPADDHRSADPSFNEPTLSRNLQLLEALRPIAHKRGKTIAQLAISWVLRRAEVTAAIVGCRKPSQIEETAAAAERQLSETEVAEVEEALQSIV